MDAKRAEFEKWVSSPPFERPINRRSEESAWPGQYVHADVQLAWDAWQDALKAQGEAEPVAWMFEFHEPELKEPVVHFIRERQTADAIATACRSTPKPLYTAPQPGEQPAIDTWESAIAELREVLKLAAAPAPGGDQS